MLGLKCIPACAVTSVNSMGPDGRGGVGLADGTGVWLTISGEAAPGAVGAGCLHPENRENKLSSRQKMIELRRISNELSLSDL